MAQWQYDPTHSGVTFAIKHMMISTVRGSFNDVSATLNFDPENPADASVEAVIQVASIDTGTTDRDNHLRSADFFDVENYPTIIFKSTSVELQDNNVARVNGDLTIRGTTHPATLEVTYLGSGTNPYGIQVAGFEASTKINREDFGLTWNVALETGGILVGKDVKIELDVQFNPVKETETA
ncbi:MAG: YceI family protein [Chloroflexota bacterium]